MKAEKTHTANKKKKKVVRYLKIERLKYRQYHIKDLNIIIKLLYPYRQSINKFSRLLNQMSFSDSQLELLHTTIHSLTMINEMYRDQNKYGQLYSTREDVVNAIYLLQNELDLQKAAAILPASTRWFYSQLQQYFSGMEFTNAQVRFQLLKSRSSCYRHLSELVDRELIELVGKKGTALVYRIIESNSL